MRVAAIRPLVLSDGETGLYWSMSAVMALIGGLVAIGYGFKEVRVFAAINIGASAPVLIKSAFANFGPSSKPNIN